MITDDDVKKLSKVFITKNDLTSMEARQDKKYATKDDLKQFKEDILESVDGKLVATERNLIDQIDKKLAAQKKDIVQEVSGYIADTLVPMFEERDTRLKRVEKKVNLPAFVD